MSDVAGQGTGGNPATCMAVSAVSKGFITCVCLHRRRASWQQLPAGTLLSLLGGWQGSPIVQQFTKEGNIRNRSLKADPMGDMQMTRWIHERTLVMYWANMLTLVGGIRFLWQSTLQSSASPRVLGGDWYVVRHERMRPAAVRIGIQW